MATYSPHSLEVLMDAYDAHKRAGDFETTDAPRAWIKAYNRMLDAAIDCGMAYDHVDPTAWIAARLTRLLVSA